MRTRWQAAVVTAVALTVAGCTSGTPNGSSGTTATTVTTAPVPPSTLLDPTRGVTVPFTADGDAFVVTDSPPPADLSEDRAVARFYQLRDATKQPTVIAVVSGLVTVRAGLSPDPIVGRPAWIIVYTRGGAMPSCPAVIGMTLPLDASHLQAVVIMGEHPLPDYSGHTIGPIFGYDGAGTGPCEPSPVPTILTEDQLNHGEG